MDLTAKLKPSARLCIKRFESASSQVLSRLKRTARATPLAGPFCCRGQWKTPPAVTCKERRTGFSHGCPSVRLRRCEARRRVVKRWLAAKKKERPCDRSSSEETTANRSGPSSSGRANLDPNATGGKQFQCGRFRHETNRSACWSNWLRRVTRLLAHCRRLAYRGPHHDLRRAYADGRMPT